jgi:hypothetical protein
VPEDKQSVQVFPVTGHNIFFGDKPAGPSTMPAWDMTLHDAGNSGFSRGKLSRFPKA